MKRLVEFLPVVIFVLLLNYGWALECYVCNSHYDHQCNDPFYSDDGQVRSGDLYLQDCSSEYGERVFCRKAFGGVDYVERGCGWFEELEEEMEREWREGGQGSLDIFGCYTHRKRGKMCVCYNDRCNGTMAINFPSMIVLITVTLSLLC